MIPPELWPAAPTSRGTAFIDGNGGLCVGDTRIRLRRNALPMHFHLHRFFGLGRGRCLGFLLREGTGMHDEKPSLCLMAVSVRILDVDVTQDTLAPPAPWRLLLGAPWFF
jgi:hypothetical protein